MAEPAKKAPAKKAAPKAKETSAEDVALAKLADLSQDQRDAVADFAAQLESLKAVSERNENQPKPEAPKADDSDALKRRVGKDLKSAIKEFDKDFDADAEQPTYALYQWKAHDDGTVTDVNWANR